MISQAINEADQADSLALVAPETRHIDGNR